jgi:hypothetical protein
VAAGLIGLTALTLFLVGAALLLSSWRGDTGPAAGPPAPPPVPPAAPPPAPPFAAIGAAVRAHDYRKSPTLGGAFAQLPFEEVAPEGGVLIGFEVALTGSFEGSLVNYLQPIYLTAKGERHGPGYGLLTERTLTVKAKPGFAVGALSIRGGGLLDGFSVTFMKLGPTGLDRDGAYRSDWIGGTGGGGPETVGGDGSFVIGIHGKLVDGVKPGSLGVVLFRPKPE